MNLTLENAVAQFLRRHIDATKPLLLGFSGGPDSMCLLGILLKIRKNQALFGLPDLAISLAHVNHHWRDESMEEARQIGELAKEFGLQLHLKDIYPEQLEGNLEAACRQERLLFFSQLCRDHGYQAVMLGHHADDQAETVLKRLFEGGSLPYLSGLQESSRNNDLRLWRPFINITKGRIRDWLARHQMQAFEDRTNLDPRFLRGKLRTRIIPQLAAEFGKEISPRLCILGAEAAELRHYMDQRIDPYLKRIVRGSMGLLLDLGSDHPDSPYEIKYLVRKTCEMANFTLPGDCVDFAAHALAEKLANREVIVGDHKLYLDRGCLFVEQMVFGKLPPNRTLEKGTFHYGPWSVTVAEAADRKLKSTGWREAWEGKIEAVVPKGDYYVGYAENMALYPGNSSISKWWTNAKVPAFLRHRVPVLWDNTRIRYEFLTGKTGVFAEKPQEFIKISLKTNNEVFK